MTVRLYYQDPFLFHFKARVLSCRAEGAGYAVELDRTCFYPEGGGQPTDQGTLGGRRVLAVREEKERVLHLLDGPLEAEEAEGLVDEARRRDHMEQHTGQHLLSAAFLAAIGTPTVSMRIGELDCTIDLTRPALSEEEADQAEDLVNRVIREDRPIHCFYPSLDELETLTLRKTPQVDENIRVVRVEGFDNSPCCGTHCPSTGRVGMVKLRRWEHYKGMTRVTFLCGNRALADYRWKNRAVNRLAETFSVRDQGMEAKVRALADDHVEAVRALRRSRADLLRHEARGLLEAAPRLAGGLALVVHRLGDGHGIEELKVLAEALVKEPAVVFLGGAGGERSSLLFARGAAVAPDMSVLLKASVGPFGGKGGGNPVQAQGGVAGEHLDAVLAAARAKLQGG